ncbi:CBD9-like protein [Macrolepiota fuliginosa MF-IS2]|uniref:CBD9-like protein n=1 Tax=Macrolepiota fuliginosa MF-IS2 TaxID=1400762 RepID=A0A9P5XMN5_9AGAR|nr:CBD9-like protein [Macrolepiota fuliginosa MF-IS2]
MCVAATVNGSSVDYVLSSTGEIPVGWMAIGFGTQMPNTPMVIMWANSDDSITLSQRSARGFVMPTVDTNPPRQATLKQALSSTSSSNTHFAFSIPANGDTTQDIIFAFGQIHPDSAAVDATLDRHLEFGTGRLDLTKQNSPSSTQPVTAPTGQSPIRESIPLLPYQRMIVAHAIFCVVGFLVLLPAGALIGRYLRTFTPTWFRGHWIAQFALAGPTIVVGLALGVQSVNKAGMHHLNDVHKRLGVVIFVFYIAQCSLGALIHWVKPRNIKYRPPQNYFHAIFGLAIIALAFYQVRVGYKIEWPKATGRGPVSNGVNIIYWTWVALLPLAYALGLGFLKKQYQRERRARRVVEPVVSKYEEDD